MQIQGVDVKAIATGLFLLFSGASFFAHAEGKAHAPEELRRKINGGTYPAVRAVSTKTDELPNVGCAEKSAMLLKDMADPKNTIVQTRKLGGFEVTRLWGGARLMAMGCEMASGRAVIKVYEYCQPGAKDDVSRCVPGAPYINAALFELPAGDKETARAGMSDELQLRLYELFDDTGQFARFDAELRQALKSGSAEQLSFLVRYPMEVFGTEWGPGAVVIKDVTDLQINYSRIFSKELVATVLKGTPEEFPHGFGVRYSGDGEVGVYPFTNSDGSLSYKISEVVLSGKPDSHSGNKASILFQCETEKHRILIDLGPGEDSYRYRAWNKPKSLVGKPDLELIAPRAERYDGTGPCRYRSWAFSRGGVRYEVSEGSSCGEGPRGSGDLSVDVKGARKEFTCH